MDTPITDEGAIVPVFAPLDMAEVTPAAIVGFFLSGHHASADLDAEIIRLRAEVERLTAENQEFRDQFADADEIAALIKQHGGDLGAIPGWVKQTWPDWHALADQLAEALRYCEAPTMACPIADRLEFAEATDEIDFLRMGLTNSIRVARAALAAYEAAHKETT
jgi:hypothetical protein